MQAKIKPRTHKTQMISLSRRSHHLTWPPPGHWRSHSTQRKLICLALPEHVSGDDRAILECLCIFQSGTVWPPSVRAQSWTSAPAAGTRHPALAVSPSPPGAGDQQGVCGKQYLEAGTAEKDSTAGAFME